MTRRKTFLWLAAAAGYTGFGLLVGYLLSDRANNAALWISGILLFFFAILLGMYISASSDRKNPEPTEPTDTPPSSSSQSPFDSSK